MDVGHVGEDVEQQAPATGSCAGACRGEFRFVWKAGMTDFAAKGSRVVAVCTFSVHFGGVGRAHAGVRGSHAGLAAALAC